VDQGCHNCDAVAALRDQIAFDEALDVVLEFQRRVPDTLVVITTDHGNANLGLNGSGSAYGQSSFLFDNVMNVKKSFPELLKLLRKTDTVRVPSEFDVIMPPKDPDADPEDKSDEDKAEAAAKEAKNPIRGKDRERITVVSTQDIIEIFRAWTGYKVTPRRAELLAPFLAKKGECLYHLMKSDVAQMGQLMANHLGIGFTGTAHTADYVLLTALGPGSERFRGFIQNTDVFYHYLALAGIDFRNPTEPLAAEARPAADEVENVEEYNPP
jgi:alkaline phosphatase